MEISKLLKSVIDYPKEFAKSFPSIFVSNNGKQETEESVFNYNKQKAQQILTLVEEGVSVFTYNDTLEQFHKIFNGEKILDLNPNDVKIEILEVIAFILNKAKDNNRNEIMIGSFIRSSSSGHKSGRSIDINCADLDWEKSDTPLNMVIFILNQLLELSDFTFGIGLPYQGHFLKLGIGKKFTSIPRPEVISNELKNVIGKHLLKGCIVFPDNDGHLHIQIQK